MMRYQRKWKVQDNITHIKPFVTEINALHSPTKPVAISDQQSVVRKIDHKLAVCGTADDCLKQDFDRDSCDSCDLL